MPSLRPMTKSGWGVRSRVLEGDRDQLVPGERGAPPRSGRTRGPRGRRSRTPRTAGRARGSPAGAPGPWSAARRRPPRSRRPAIVTAAIRPAAPNGRRCFGAPPRRVHSTAAARAGPNGARRTPSSVTIAGDQLGRRDVEGRDCAPCVSAGAIRWPRDLEDLVRPSAPRSGSPTPSGVARSTRARGATDDERHAVAGGQDRQRVRPDLVRGVAVGGDPVRTDEDRVDLAARIRSQPAATSAIERVRDAGLGRAPRPSAARPGGTAGSRRPRRGRPLGVVGRLDDAERRPVLAAGERPGVAVGQQPERVGRPASGSSARPSSASRPWSSVASKTIASASARIASAMSVAVGRQLADRLVAGHDAARPPQRTLTAVGRALMSALAPPRRVALRAYG